MLSLKNLFLNVTTLRLIPVAGLKNFPPPINYDHVEFTERPKLKVMEKVPQYPGNLKPPKMQKKLKFMRGPERVHNFLTHKQYGIQALGGGRLRFGHFEMLRLSIGRKIDTKRMFTFWRIDPPWQPVTNHGQGQRMGGGKGAIDHYVTPVKAGRIIVELGGICEFKEVKEFLQKYADQLPFKARAVSHEMLEKEKIWEKEREESDMNPWPMKYLVVVCPVIRRFELSNQVQSYIFSTSFALAKKKRISRIRDS
ncbi:CLUMA_CG004164, isoform B [Clunio marinus]|uniref:Large ribosomal subunit protein uL16m n=1 Tax=Clunio marinus TaxID=568069 RepID=A0A1J1HVC5_9DIPT|nr:CLUMA_CG004164, isoform B [Clunio marinus]